MSLMYMFKRLLYKNIFHHLYLRFNSTALKGMPILNINLSLISYLKLLTIKKKIVLHEVKLSTWKI